MLRSVCLALVVLFAADLTSHAQGEELDPCVIYSTYSDDWRDPSAEAELDHCDSHKREGWFTFLVRNKRAQIPTTCLQDNTCGGQVPRHIDLDGQAMPGPGQTISAFLCGSFSVMGYMECCVFREPVQIKNCTDPPALIYLLPKPPSVCPVTTCAVPVGEEVDRQYRYEPGDTPRSLQITTVTTALPDPTTTDVDECTDMEGVCGAGECHNTPGSYFCSCFVGYKWDPEARRCVDIDECEDIVNVCRSPQLKCNNTEGNFSCGCAENLLPSPDGLPCFEVTTTLLLNTTDGAEEENTTATAETTTAETTSAETSTAASIKTTSSIAEMTSPSMPPPDGFYTLNLLLLQTDFMAVDNLESHLKEAVMSSDLITVANILVDVKAVVSLPDVLTAHVTLNTNASGDVVSVQTVEDIVDLTDFHNHLPENVTLLAACMEPGRWVPQTCAESQTAVQSPFSAGYNHYLLILIAVVVCVALCLVVYVSARLYKHCSQQGSWVLPQDKKSDEESAHSADTKPATPGTPGDQPDWEAKGPDADRLDNNGEWSVIPLDQAPTDHVDSNAKTTQDTPM